MPEIQAKSRLSQNGHGQEGNGTGEVCSRCLPTLIQLRDANQGLQQTILQQAAKLGRYERERDPEVRAREHPRWHEIQELFEEWRVWCRHPNCRFSPKRFQLAVPFVESFGMDLCKRAVRGAAYDPFKTQRKNGSTKRHDSWELIFREDDKFEEFCNRAPRRKV